MRPTAVTRTGTGDSPPVVLNRQMPAGLYCVVSGTVDYTIQVTGDGTTYFPHPTTALVGATTNQRGTIDFPVLAVRAKVNSGTGSVTMTVLQDERAGG